MEAAEPRFKVTRFGVEAGLPGCLRMDVGAVLREKTVLGNGDRVVDAAP